MSPNTYAQNEKYNALTIKDGLPSNFIYQVIEDNRGFLWVATDAGLAKFDGKRFQVFTKKDGLPDNEVISIAKEKNGRIWVNCFKQDPAYFDEVKNRFVCPINKKELAAITSTLNMYLFTFPKEGVMYTNGKGNFVFKDKKLTIYNDFRTDLKLGLIKLFNDGSEVRTGSVVNKQRRSLFWGLYHIKNNKILDSTVILKKALQKIAYASIDNEKYYLTDSAFKKCYIFSNFTSSPFGFSVDSLPIPERFINMFFTKTSLYLVSHSGKIYVYNKFSHKLTSVLNGNYLPNSYYDDSKGNRWVGTIDKGLILYRKTPLKTLSTPKNYLRTNFLSIAKTKSGTLLAGNYYGEVLEMTKSKSFIHMITKMASSKIRKILIAGNDVFTFSEQGTFYNYKNPIMNPSKDRLHMSKTALVLNDSIIIVGTHYALDELNTKTKKIRNLSPKAIRITALAKKDQYTVYFGSLNGLYRYDVRNDTYTALTYINKSLNDKIAALCYTNDNVLWVSTAANGIMAVKDDKVILGSVLYDGQYRDLISTKNGQLWAATSNGISILNYQLKANRINYSIRNLTTNDGLASNDVHELAHHDQFVYAATTNGISVIPENFTVSKVNIPTYLTRMSVNQKDTILAKQYNLAYDQQSIQMQFSGVDLTGHFKYLQYNLNSNANWTSLNDNTLNIQLNSGVHFLKVRAVDVSGNFSNYILITFTVATPFWKSVWFWLMIAIILQIIIIYVINKQQKKKKEFKLAKKFAAVQTAELEQQAFTALMNPHFIFNALNSIQHYINVQDRKNANRYLSDFASLIRKNFEAAQHSFIPLEEELENIKLYLNLEQMRFNDQFEFSINIDTQLEIEDWMIPTMILQPLLENALLHGIMPSSIKGNIDISIEHKDGELCIFIIDNGIGLLNSEVLKSNATHKSHGMALIKKRIKALNTFDLKPITINMEPAFESLTNPGNKITFLIPDQLYAFWLNAKKFK